jgi:hypothetical protein
MAADPIDERYDEIVRGLRALPGAPAELRVRVVELAAVADTPRPRRRGLRVALALGLVVVAAVAAISLTSGGSRTGQQKLAGEAATGGKAATRQRAAPPRSVFAPAVHPKLTELGLPITPGRLTQVHASLRLDYGTPSGGNGDAYLTVRIPVGNVQKAVTRFTALGLILSQHLSIRDLQNQANAEVLRILQLRQLAAQLRAKLQGSLTPEERVAVQARLDTVRGLLRAKTGQHAGTLREGRLSTFELELTTRKGAAAAPSHPGRIGRAARHAFSALSKTIAGLLYVLIVLSPLLVLAAAVLWGARYRRRRGEQRLLARA